MEEIIKKAIEGGYAIQKSYYARPVVFTKLKTTNEYYTVFELDDTTVVEDKNGEEVTVPLTSSHQTSMIILDPLFWQALGKASGWEGTEDIAWMDKNYYTDGSIVDGFYNGLLRLEKWRFHAFRFHDINLTEGFEKAVAYVKETTRGTALVN